MQAGKGTTCCSPFALAPHTKVVKFVLQVTVSLAWPVALGQPPCMTGIR